MLDLNLEIKKHLLKKYGKIDLLEAEGLFEISFCQYVYIKFKPTSCYTTVSREFIRNIVNHTCFQDMNLCEDYTSFTLNFDDNCITEMEEEFVCLQMQVSKHIDELFKIEE
jgi:hypothetical protein